jgi:hypothetical protein
MSTPVDARETLRPHNVLDRFRLGVGIGPAYLFVFRASEDASISRVGFDAHVQGAFDLVQWDPQRRSALFLRARGEADFFWGGATAYGVTGALGLRL